MRPRGAGGITLDAIAGAERVHGAFAVATPIPLAGSALEVFELAAEAIAARVDQFEHAIENEALRSRLVGWAAPSHALVVGTT